MRRPISFVLFATALVAAAFEPASAHGPTPQKAEEKVTIAAPREKVWELVRAFGPFCGWHPGIDKCEAEGGDAPGATRKFVLKSNGGQLSESLDEYNDKDTTYAYRLAQENVSAFPVSFYSATLTVAPAGEGSEVTWSARFYRGDTGNFPSEEQNDAAAQKAMSEFMRAGLEGLKAKLGAKS